MTTAQYRRYIPIGTRLEACLLAMGFTLDQIRGGEIIWDHMPPLGTREIVDGKMVPDPNDPRYIQPILEAANKVKTFGTRATTAGSDIANIAKAKRLAKKHSDFRERVLAPNPESKPERPRRWPSRPFPQRRAK